MIDVGEMGRIRRYSICDTYVLSPLWNDAVATLSKQPHVHTKFYPFISGTIQCDSLPLRLKQRRCELQMSARKLAGMAGCNYKTILRYESGESSLDSGDGAKYLAKISPVLGIDLRALDEYLSFSNDELRAMVIGYLRDNKLSMTAFAGEVGVNSKTFENYLYCKSQRIPRFVWEVIREKDREP